MRVFKFYKKKKIIILGMKIETKINQNLFQKLEKDLNQNSFIKEQQSKLLEIQNKIKQCLPLDKKKNIVIKKVLIMLLTKFNYYLF